MADYIDRKKAREEACRRCTHSIGEDGCGYPEPCGKLIAAFLNAESSNVVPADAVREDSHGRWEEIDWIEPDGHGFGTVRIRNRGLRCNQCANVFKKEHLWKKNFCPNCGARMIGVE